MTARSRATTKRSEPVGGSRRPRTPRSGRWLVSAGLVAVILLVTAVASGPLRQQNLANAAEGPLSFPRTATIFLDQDSLPSIDVLAKYDIVVVDAEWQNRLPLSVADTLHAKNPRVKLLAYVNLVDSVPRTGSPEYYANAYSLWQFKNSTTSTFPRQWLAYTAVGKPVHEYQDRTMANLTDEAPKVNGQIYAQYAANWVVDDVWSRGIWDGIFLDVWGDTIYSADSNHWDINGDGVDEPDSAIYGPGGPLDRGLTIAERIMRARMPGALIVANGDRSATGDTIDGLVLESFVDSAVDPDQDAVNELSKYVRTSLNDGLRQPTTTITIDQRRNVTAGSAEDYRRARFFLTSTLLQNGWWAPMGADYGEPVYYDEMDGAGIGRGYLGQPLVASPDIQDLTTPSSDGTGTPAPDVFRRDFDHGISLVNAGDQTRTITLEHSYRHLDGTQDRSVNNGAVVTSVTIPPKDGVILLRIS